MSITYKEAGVNIDAANAATERIKKLARSTFNINVMSEIGSFGGMFNAKFDDTREPVLVASCDGVGTKLKVAFALNRHVSIGTDLVAKASGDGRTIGVSIAGPLGVNALLFKKMQCSLCSIVLLAQLFQCFIVRRLCC